MASGRTTLVLCAILSSASADAETVSDTTWERGSTADSSRLTLTPGRVPPLPSSALPVARERFRDGDYQGTISTLSSGILDAGTPWSTTRQATHFLLGMAHFAVGNWNLASSNFTKVRIMDGPLAAHAAWYEARADHRRGRSTVAALECEGYRKTWPDGPHFDACLLLSAHAYNTSGQHSKAAEAYDSWLRQNPDSPKAEEVSLARALMLTHTQPERSVVLLRELVDHHRFHATAVTALATLEELGESVDEDPRSVTTLVARCESALACGRHDRAWDLLIDIRALSPDSRTARQWVSENELRVAWTTRRFPDYQQIARRRYEASPNGDDAWRIFKALRRSGDWAGAVTWGRQSMHRHGSHWRWQRARDDLAWAEMRSGELSSARDRWKPLGRLYGHSGRDARFYHAFSAYLMGDHEAAEADFTELTETGREWRAAAHYWRAKSREVRGDNQGAASDRALARKLDYTGWYRLLLTSNSNFLESSENWGVRDGTWNGPGTTQLPSWSSYRTLQPSGIALPRTTQGTLRLQPNAPGWSALSWPLLPSSTTDPPQPSTRTIARSGNTIPGEPEASPWYDPEQAQTLLDLTAIHHAKTWPWLPTAAQLVRAGLWTEAGRIVGEAYEEWRRRWHRRDRRSLAMRNMNLTDEDWRAMLILSGNAHHSAALSRSLTQQAEDEDASRAAKRLAYPVIYGANIWSLAQTYNLDPLLVLSLVRQESAYMPEARSKAGAIGLTQVMPSTGARLAEILGDSAFSTEALEDPRVSLRYGAAYLSLVLSRFNESFPLALASYNGGPHNVSRWMRPLPVELGLDARIEMVPWSETRNYVKSVSGHFAAYTDLYGPQNSEVVVSQVAYWDDPTVVDF